MSWKAKFETVIQLAPAELKLFKDRHPACVLDKYQLPVRKGINRSGEFPVAAVRHL